MPDTTVEVDIQPVAPKDRYERIMGAYESLAVGETMQLTVDHDPLCMYYALRATQGDDNFSFEYLERGPETWCVLVTRRGIGDGGAR
jgi:uncharacterized protein (DUF2249 family)